MELGAVRGRKELRGKRPDAHETDHRRDRSGHHGDERRAQACAHHLVESPGERRDRDPAHPEGCGLAVLPARIVLERDGKEQPGERGPEGDRKEERGDQRRHHADGNGSDELARPAWQKRDGHEGEHRCERRGEKRRKEALHRGPYRIAGRQPVKEPAADRIGHDDRGVDQKSERHHETGDRHLVDRYADDVEDDDGGKARERDRRRDDERGPPSERHEEHHDHEPCAHEEVRDERAETGVRIGGLVEDRLQLHPAGEVLLEKIKLLGDARRPRADAKTRLHPRGDHHRRAPFHEGEIVRGRH